MPQVEPEWAIVQEAEDIARRLIDKYPEKLGHIGVDEIGVAAIVNKPRPDTADWFAKTKGIKHPEALYCPKKYIIFFHMDTWDQFDPVTKQYMILAELMRIPDPPDGSVLKKDIQDVKALVKTFGVDYLENANKPNLLEEKQVF